MLPVASLIVFYEFLIFFFSVRLVPNIVLLIDQAYTPEAVYTIAAIYKVGAFYAILGILAEKQLVGSGALKIFIAKFHFFGKRYFHRIARAQYLIAKINSFIILAPEQKIALFVIQAIIAVITQDKILLEKIFS